MVLQRFTIRLTYQVGRKLGLAFIDRDVEESDSDYDLNDFFSECDDSDGDAYEPIHIRGGGGDNDNGNFIQSAVKIAEAAKATIATAARAAGMMQAQPVVPIQQDLMATAVHVPLQRPAFNNKRKRASDVYIEMNKSMIWLYARRIHESVKQKQPNIDCSNLDELLHWSQLNVPDKVRDLQYPLDGINVDSLKFALSNAITPNDKVVKVEHTIPTQTIPNSNKPKYREGKRRHRPYFRSDHYKTVFFQNRIGGATELFGIMQKPEHYPLYLTLERNVYVPSTDKSASKATNVDTSCKPPPAKRLKTSNSTVNAVHAKDEVICLLDSSDEDEGEKAAPEKNDVTTSKQQSATEQKDDDKAIDVDPSTFVQLVTDSSLPVSLKPRKVPSDPTPMSYGDETGGFVLTPYGAGKILSSRVERHPSSSNTECTIYKPAVVYSIDLEWGTCHVPASQVKSIVGTSYTEKTLLTYNRVPLNRMDLLRLRPMTYLNDSIINFYLKHLMVQYYQNKGNNDVVSTSRDWDDLDGEGIHIFPSFCYTRIVDILGPSSNGNTKTNRQKIWNELKSWTKRIDIFQKKMLIFPINQALHWTCVVVFHPGRMVRKHARRKMTIQSQQSQSVVNEAKQPMDAQSESSNVMSDKIALEGIALIEGVNMTLTDAVEAGSSRPVATSNQRNNASDTAIPVAASSQKQTDPKPTIVDLPTTKPKGETAPTSTPAEEDEIVRWKCDYCMVATFDAFDEAVEHEKFCEWNLEKDWIMIHFDSGKHFRLHDTSTILGNIRKYLSAYYEGDYASTHPGIKSFNKTNMPGNTTTVPQQDNTKDCGVYMLEFVERMLSNPPHIDDEFVKKGVKSFAKDLFSKSVIEKKRDDILQLVHSIRLGEQVE